MQIPYVPPTRNADNFNCVHCGVRAPQKWSQLRFNYSSQSHPLVSYGVSICEFCRKVCVWRDQEMIDPSFAGGAMPHRDLPDDCAEDFREAQSVFASSPRSAAALLRLCIQKLMAHLGESGKDINGDIASLVSKGLPPLVQQALDYCRVVGNNAVHPGELNIQDSPEIAAELFRMINFVVEDRISRPKQIQAMYDALPAGARKQIDRRDQQKRIAPPAKQDE